LTYPFGPQSGLTDSLTAATIGEPPVDDDRWHAPNPETLGSIRDCCILHVEHRYVTGGASNIVYKIDCLLTRRTPSAKNFDFSFVIHKTSPFDTDLTFSLTVDASESRDSRIGHCVAGPAPEHSVISFSRVLRMRANERIFSSMSSILCAATSEHQHTLLVALLARPTVSLSLSEKTQALALA
jgi:hypothetical protein